MQRKCCVVTIEVKVSTLPFKSFKLILIIKHSFKNCDFKCDLKCILRPISSFCKIGVVQKRDVYCILSGKFQEIAFRIEI